MCWSSFVQRTLQFVLPCNQWPKEPSLRGEAWHYFATKYLCADAEGDTGNGHRLWLYMSRHSRRWQGVQGILENTAAKSLLETSTTHNVFDEVKERGRAGQGRAQQGQWMR